MAVANLRPVDLPLAVKRTRWLHHFQAWSPKLKRRVSLYSRANLAVWLLIEASPDIEYFCERPGHVLVDGKRVLADFRVQRDRQTEFFVLLGSAKLSLLDDPGGLMDPCPIRIITPEWTQDRAQLIANWTRILPVITTGMPFVHDSLLDEVHERIQSVDRLVDIERRHLPRDPILTRATVFELTRRGRLIAGDLQSQSLSGATRFAKAG